MAQKIVRPTINFICVLTLLVGRAHCLLTVQPRDEYVVKGSTVVLACSTTLDVPVMWIYKRTAGGEDQCTRAAGGEDQWMIIYQMQNKSARFQMSIDNTTGQYNLTIQDVQLEDAGTFRCIDDEGYGFALFLDGIPDNVATAELNVVDNELNCVTNGNVQCLREENFQSDHNSNMLIAINCTLNFGGTLTPVLKWTLLKNAAHNSNRSVSLQRFSRQTVTNGLKYSTVVSEVVLPASQKLNQSQISCQLVEFSNITTSTQPEPNQFARITWTSAEIRILGFAEAFISSCFSIEIIQHNRSVTGVTVVGEEIYVVRDGQSQVNVYDSHSLRASRDINIPGMTSPQGLAGCAYNRALYISDDGLKCIHRVDLTNNSVTRWEMRENHVPRGLSVTAEHTLLVTVWINSGTRGESGVVEYTSEGQQVREIRFDRSIQYAEHTVQLSSDQFIVPHGDFISRPHRVCVINAEGQIIKSFGREGRVGEDKLNMPLSIAIDENSKHVFVADWWNHRVLMLDSELMTRLGEVHVSRDLSWPHRLYFDSSTDRLFVAEGGYSRFSYRLFVVTRPEFRN